jgi:hypothetical protein
MEYEGAKDIIKGITRNFTKEVSKVIGSLDRIENETNETKTLANETLKASKEALGTAKKSLLESDILSARLDETEKAVESFREELQRVSSSRPITLESDIKAPIPLQQDAVFEQLTPTEIEVLAIIEEIGEGSVPAIRERIKKTREHTARMLKKLYERGFIDRNTSGMPYRYNIRKEIRDVIKKQKNRMKLAV